MSPAGFEAMPGTPQQVGADANQIKHDHSPKIIFVLDPRHD